MIYFTYFVYILILVVGCILVNRSVKENDLLNLWAGIIFIVGMFTAIMFTIKNQQDPIVLEDPVVLEEGPYIIELDFGTFGIKAFQDEKTKIVYVVSCFQGEGDNVTDCWDKRFIKDSDDGEEINVSK